MSAAAVLHLLCCTCCAPAVLRLAWPGVVQRLRAQHSLGPAPTSVLSAAHTSTQQRTA